MTTILAFIVVLGILVFVHEAGHFAAAKLSRIRVLRFSFGFGKVLLSFTWRGTEYALSLLPLGGYVKMAGGDERDREGAPDEFLSKPPWVRMIVAFAGPAMNFVLAIILFAGIRIRVDRAPIPQAFKGYPVAFITASLMSLAFLGFKGLMGL